jgi:hypothetical protein
MTPRWHATRDLANGLVASTRLLISLILLAACHRNAAVNSAVRGSADSSGVGAAPVSRIPRDAARFEIEVVDDSTARFKPREAGWVRDGMTAWVVDPLNRDALVARTRIVSVWNETAVAVVTSQVTRVTTQHVVLMTPPLVPWWKTRRFWMGTAIGAVVGGTAGATIRH